MTDKKRNLIYKIYQYCYPREVWLSIIIMATLLGFAMWPLLLTPNSYYPMTIDGMGHLTKIQYIADCLRELKWPAWFPYWYNGSTVTQYYPPLSYYLLVPVQLIFNNIMITFKFFGFFSLLVGSIGVWRICRRFIGPWVGIWAGAIYAIDPLLTYSLFFHGVVAQGPIFALSPWFLYFSLLFFKVKSKICWLAVCVFITALILSHAMHAFMVAFIVGLMGLFQFFQRKINLKIITLWSLAVIFGAALVSFWWAPGVTQWENPGIPYLLSEAVESYTAKISWFTLAGRNSEWFYYAIPLNVIAVLTVILSQFLRKRDMIRKKRGQGVKSHDLGLFYSMAAGLLLSIFFSFGYQIPGYKYIPMHENLVAGRILSFSVCLATVISAYFVLFVMKYWDQGYRRIAGIIILITCMAFMLVDINPRRILFYSNPCVKQKEDMELIPAEESPSENGRFAWVMPVLSDTSYFPMTRKLFMTDGWNIEGTLHNRAIWQHNIAISCGCSNYVVRNLLFWNTRSAFVLNSFTRLIDDLASHGFRVLNNDGGKSILYNPAPSSYFLRQERDAIVIGKAAINFEMNFPWMARGYSNCLEDYPSGYLAGFKLIYIIEPQIKNFNKFQRIVEDLAEAGKMVIVSMGREETWPLLDIIPYWETIESYSMLKSCENAEITKEARIGADPAGQAPVPGNMDEIWALLQGADRQIPAIGYKEINGHRVYFVGLALGQQLNWADGGQIREILEQLMDLAHPNKSIVPHPFPVLADQWRHDGFSFRYDVQEPTPVLVSVTYTPRWKARLDGKPLLVQNLDNLIYIELPEGEHQVSFHYGMTWVGALGIALSLFSLLLLALFYYFFDYYDPVFDRLKEIMRRFISNVGK